MDAPRDPDPAAPGRVLVVANPVSGRGRGARLARRAAEVLATDAAEVEVYLSDGPGAAVAAVAERADEVGLVVSVGGDGTLREVVLGLARAPGLTGDVPGPEVALLPAGNGNVAAWEYGIPRDLEGALAVVRHGETLAVDALRVEDELALANVGIGYDGAVATRVQRARRGRFLGAWYARSADTLYGLLGVVALFDRAPVLAVEVDGRALPEPCAGLVVSNMETYGKNWSMTPGASASDGLLDFNACRRRGVLATLRTLRAAATRRPAPASVARLGRAGRLGVSSDRPFAWQVDGDAMPARASLEVSVVPRAFRLRVPRGAGA